MNEIGTFMIFFLLLFFALPLFSMQNPPLPDPEVVIIWDIESK